MSTDLSEKALETLIVDYLTSEAGGWLAGNPKHYDREYAVDLAQLAAFLKATQPDKTEALDLDQESPTQAEVPGPPPGRDHQARHRRCAAQGHSAWPPRP